MKIVSWIAFFFLLVLAVMFPLTNWGLRQQVMESQFEKTINDWEDRIYSLELDYQNYLAEYTALQSSYEEIRIRARALNYISEGEWLIKLPESEEPELVFNSSIQAREDNDITLKGISLERSLIYILGILFMIGAQFVPQRVSRV